MHVSEDHGFDSQEKQRSQAPQDSQILYDNKSDMATSQPDEDPSQLRESDITEARAGLKPRVGDPVVAVLDTAIAALAEGVPSTV